ncbi:MAG: efflux RND transporter periplasmic adaptor subunit [Alphaproteobacteria bacterium]|nr:efflux RND transporter periplasmic adaptor subunit [Alphaproteobacteria bacterium]
MNFIKFRAIVKKGLVRLQSALTPITTTLKNTAGVKSAQRLASKGFKFLDRYIKFDKQPTASKVGIISAGVISGFFALWLVAKLGGLIVYNACAIVVDSGVSSKFSKRTKPAMIEAAKIVPSTISRRIQTVGKMRPNNSVILKSEINGRVTDLPIKEGSDVKKGDILVQFDDADAKAELKDADATFILREADFKRSAELKSKNIESTKKYDEAKAAFAMAEAKVETAKARLAKTQILAPFDGTLGLIEPSPGTYVQAGQEIATLVDNNPMKVDFKIPERNFHEVGMGQGLEIRLDGFQDQVFLATVEAIDSKIDHQSHSIAIRGTIPNAKGFLRGGMYANISLIVGEKGDALAVPESALEREGDIEYVWVVKRNKASRRRVLVGTKEKNKVEIITGLNPGEIVVTAGQMRFAGDGHPVKMLNLNDDGSEKPKEEQKKLDEVGDDDGEE